MVKILYMWRTGKSTYFSGAKVSCSLDSKSAYCHFLSQESSMLQYHHVAPSIALGQKTTQGLPILLAACLDQDVRGIQNLRGRGNLVSQLQVCSNWCLLLQEQWLIKQLHPSPVLGSNRFLVAEADIGTIDFLRSSCTKTTSLWHRACPTTWSRIIISILIKKDLLLGCSKE